MTDIPLPETWADSPQGWAYTADQMRSHAAAVSAAENAALRAERDNMATAIAQLLSKTTELHDEIRPLQERVKVLEGVLHEADDAFLSVNPFVPNGSDADFVLQAAWANAQAALGDKA